MSEEDNKEISLECEIVPINSYPKYKNELQKKKLIIVEGKDDLYFLNYYLKHLDIMDIEVRPIGGKICSGNLEPFIKSHRNFNSLKAIGFIVDADDHNAAHEFKRLTVEIITVNNNSPIPGLELKCPDSIDEFSVNSPRIGIYVLPNNFDSGRLEDLFLNCVRGKPGMACVLPFSTCVSELDDPPRNLSKMKALAFIATQKELPRGVGGAAQHGIWDFGSSELDKLKTFILSL
jgi:hypothetical protein